jgi:hypothetical protein
MYVSDLSHDETPGVRTRAWFRTLFGAPLVKVDGTAPAPRPPRRRRLAFAVAAVAGTYLSLYVLATLVAAPLSTPAEASPELPIAITAVGSRPVTVLAHAPAVGWRVLRVPSASADDPAQMLPAEFAGARVKLISLRGASLLLRTTGPFGHTTALQAQGSVLTIFRTPERTGVRSAW